MLESLSSRVTPGHPNAAQVSYCTADHNVLARPNGAKINVHPSEPNYIWQEAGTNFGIFNDNDPYASVKPTVPAIQAYLAVHPNVSGQHLTGLLQAAGISWNAYQEDTNLLNTDGGNINQGGTPTNVPVARKALTVPLVTFSGTASTYTNPYNGSNQFSFACKHDGTLFFVDTNGGDDPTSFNKEARHYLPLQQLAKDYSHSSDLNALQKIFQVTASTPTGYLNGAADPSRDGAVDLSDLFQSGVIPSTIPPIH